MAGYRPTYIKGNATGLVQNREEMILPNDAYPILQNAYVWRERIIRKQGYQLLGRLQRDLTAVTTTNSLLASYESTATIAPGSVTIVDSAGTTWTDAAQNGVLVGSPSGTGTINYATGVVTGPVPNNTSTFAYYPGLPAMGIRIWEQNSSATDITLFFDQKYCYEYNSSSNLFQEFLPGTTWNAQNENNQGVSFFWSTNYWNSDGVNFSTNNVKLFWVTNNTGQFGANADPIRITDGVKWLNFSPPDYGQIDSTNFLCQCLAFLPFRGRLLAFNTWEGTGYGSLTQYRQRIRWSAIGNPFIAYSAGPPATGSWRDDIRGQGGYLDMPTTEDIVAVGFVRDNLVIYCERSTWQLRYTGRTISPFQIERVNSELGTESTFGAVQFDTSLIGIGTRGIVECDSFKSNKIDVKIPDFTFTLQNLNNGVARIQGIRNFETRLAYWTYCTASLNGIFPDSRLVYNYEDDSWAIFTDSLTTLGYWQTTSSRTWLNTPLTWLQCDFTWLDQPQGDQIIVGGNQQGFVEQLDQLSSNDVSLYIKSITPNGTNPVVINSPSHNLQTGSIISISGIPTGTPYAYLNGVAYGILLGDNTGANTADNFRIYTYEKEGAEFTNPVVDTTTGYVGIGYISVLDNFKIQSKKFNFTEEGQSVQMGYIDILMEASEAANACAITMNVYLDYNTEYSSNVLGNQIAGGPLDGQPDDFFNATIPTTQSTYSNIGGTKFWQRVYCPTRANFLTIEYTLSNAQMNDVSQEGPVQIDAQVLWMRPAGRNTQTI